jgi:electron transfer flavoprotein alpha subunit
MNGGVATAPLRIVVLLAGTGDDERRHESLLAAARAMHGESAPGGVEVLHLHGAGEALAPMLRGIAKWWDCTHAGLRTDAAPAALAAAAAQALQRIGVDAQGRTLVLLPPGPLGVALAATLATGCDGVSLGRCSALDVEGATVHAHKPAFGGRVVAKLRSTTWPCFAALRPAHPAASLPVGGAGERHAIELDAALPAAFATETLQSADAQRSLVGARVIVSGGRGMGGPEGFDLLHRLAQQLDAAVGGSLPTVDAGWLPVARQIGQSGKFVAPSTYVAVGISGTPQHLAGLSSESSVIALNSDPEAPIFQVADIGVVGDWQALLPRIIERLGVRELKAG